MTKNVQCVLFLFLATLPSLLRADVAHSMSWVYYSVQVDGQTNDTWHVADEKTFSNTYERVSGIYDLYRIQVTTAGQTIVKREQDSPSGDWIIYATYVYGKNGVISSLDWEYQTFLGLDSKNGDAKATIIKKRSHSIPKVISLSRRKRFLI